MRASRSLRYTFATSSNCAAKARSISVKSINSGYTVFELVIGFTVLFLFAILTLYLVNPRQLTLQKRDTNRLKNITVIGEALISYSKSKNGSLPLSNTNWLTELYSRGELSQIPKAIEYDNIAASCKNNQYNGYCYVTDGKIPAQLAIVYTKLESVNQNTKCNVSLGETAWAVYDLVTIRGGLVCTVGTEPRFSIEGQRFKD